jgi:hypothetical protein
MKITENEDLLYIKTTKVVFTVIYFYLCSIFFFLTRGSNGTLPRQRKRKEYKNRMVVNHRRSTKSSNRAYCADCGS